MLSGLSVHKTPVTLASMLSGLSEHKTPVTLLASMLSGLITDTNDTDKHRIIEYGSKYRLKKRVGGGGRGRQEKGRGG